MHNFYIENNGPIEKFLEISKDFSHNRCIEKPSKWIFLIFCIFRLKSSLMSKTLSNFDFGMFYLTSIFPESPTFPHSPHHNWILLIICTNYQVECNQFNDIFSPFWQLLDCRRFRNFGGARNILKNENIFVLFKSPEWGSTFACIMKIEKWLENCWKFFEHFVP